MENRLKMINWLLVVAVVVCIIAHRVFLSEVSAGENATSLANFLQILIIGIAILFLMMVAGMAIFVWQKINMDPNQLAKNPPKFPKVSFISGTAAIVIFSIYWTMLSR